MKLLNALFLKCCERIHSLQLRRDMLHGKPKVVLRT